MNVKQTYISLFVVVVSIIFAIFLYLQMCTASINENYQLGISKIHLLHPGLLLISMILLTAAIPGKAGKLMASFSQQFAYIALCICFGFFLMYFIGDFAPGQSQWSFPHERTLLSTLKISLTNPQFSNRSLAGVFYSFLFSLLLLWVSTKKSYKYKA